MNTAGMSKDEQDTYVKHINAGEDDKANEHLVYHTMTTRQGRDLVRDTLEDYRKDPDGEVDIDKVWNRNKKGGSLMKPSIEEMRRVAMQRRAQGNDAPAGPIPAEVVNAPYVAPADTAVDTAPDEVVDLAQPETTLPVAPVDEVILPPASDAASDAAPNPPVFPAESADNVAGGGGMPIQDSVSAAPYAVNTTTARAAFVKAYKLAELRVDAGIEPENIDKTVLADKISRSNTIGEIDVATSTLLEVKQASVRGVAPKSLVPRRPVAKNASPFSGMNRSARVNEVPDEAIFGL